MSPPPESEQHRLSTDDHHPGDDGYAESFVVGAGDQLTAASVALPPLDLGELLRAAAG